MSSSESPRDCIKCDSPFEQKEIMGVTIDHCAKCGGLWLDAGELQALSKSPDQSVAALEAIRAKTPTKAGETDTYVKCPACKSTLADATVEEFVVDICFSCGGVFLDHDELEQAITKYGSEKSTIVALAEEVTTAGFINN